MSVVPSRPVGEEMSRRDGDEVRIGAEKRTASDKRDLDRDCRMVMQGDGLFVAKCINDIRATFSEGPTANSRTHYVAVQYRPAVGYLFSVEVSHLTPFDTLF